MVGSGLTLTIHLSHCLAVKKLEFGVLKLYLVTAFAAGKPDKITEFYTKLALELHSQPEWKEWFCESTAINLFVCILPKCSAKCPC